MKKFELRYHYIQITTVRYMAVHYAILALFAALL